MKVKQIKKFTLKKYLLLAFILILFINLVKSWMKLRERLDFIKEAKIRLIEEQKRHEDLKRELAKTESPDFIEKQARDKLNMSREGELIILIPTPVISASPTPEVPDTAANWQKWVKLFL